MRVSCYPHNTIGWYEPQTGGGLDFPSYNLAQLTLDFGYCSQLSDVSALAALGGLQNLAQLTLDFEGCSQLSDANVRGLRGLAKCTGFTILLLDHLTSCRSKFCEIQ